MRSETYLKSKHSAPIYNRTWSERSCRTGSSAGIVVSHQTVLKNIITEQTNLGPVILFTVRIYTAVLCKVVLNTGANLSLNK